MRRSSSRAIRSHCSFAISRRCSSSARRNRRRSSSPPRSTCSSRSSRQWGAAAALDLRTDPLSGRLVVVAPNRRRRPGASAGLIDEPTEAELDECPFCEGREDRTPPESFRIGGAATWTVRVVPNLYPAFERQEVVVHSPRHVRTFAELDDHEVAALAEAWQGRRAGARAGGLPPPPPP